jgi:hypothetical protein
MLASSPGRPYCTRLDAYLASQVTCASRGALRARLRAILDMQIPVLAQVPANHLGAAAGRPATSGGLLD